MSDSSTNPVQNKVVKEYIDALPNGIDIFPTTGQSETLYQDIENSFQAGMYPVVHLYNTDGSGYGMYCGKTSYDGVQDCHLFLMPRTAFGVADPGYAAPITSQFLQFLIVKPDNTQIFSAGELLKKTDVDYALSTTSTNPVRNSVITNALNQKQDRLTIDSAMSGTSTTRCRTKLSSSTWTQRLQKKSKYLQNHLL